MATTIFKIVQKFSGIIPPRIRYKLALVYYKFDRLIKYGTTDFPIAVEVETTTACNRRCSWCPNSKFDRGLIKNEKKLSSELFYKIIDELHDLDFNGRFSPHLFGEPLFDKRMLNFMKYTRMKLPKANIVIFTNGDYLNEAEYKKYAEIGIDAFNLTQYDKDLSQRLKELIKKIDVGEICGPKINLKIINENTAVCNRGGLVEHPKICSVPKCAMPSENLNINYKGDIIICSSDYFGVAHFGNVSKERLIDVWKKKKFSTLRKEIKKGVYNLDICKKCDSRC